MFYLGNFSGKFLKNYMEFVKDFENGGNGIKNEKGSSKKWRSKKVKKVMVFLE